MSTAFKVAVLGPIPRDYITTYQHDVVEKYGCVIYPVVALSTLMSEGSCIVPVTHVRKIDQAPIHQILSSFPYVETSHVTADADQGDVIRLKYADQNQRIERQTAFMNPIVPDDLKDILDFDAFVFVPVTDFEIALGALQYLKRSSPGVVIFDAHGPTNTCTWRGERNLKFWIDRDLWLPYIDILKMNLEEAGCSWFSREYDFRTLEKNENIKLPLEELPKLARHCLHLGVKALYVTLDEYGCALYFKNPRGKMEEHFIEGVRVAQVVDTTGCGDSFAGGLAFGYLKTRDYLKAGYYANAMGAQRCTGTELAIYKDIEETEQQIADTYGRS
jgi:adenosine kinase